MENLSHSLHRNRASATLSRKIYNGNGFTAKTVYDDVFGGPPKFGVPTFSPRADDYGEIFGSFRTSRASSIPVLDLPVVDEAEVSFDVRSSKLDYSEVFGGFDGLDFAVSYDELLEQPMGGDGSSDEAWTPTESEYLSEESDPSAYAAKNQFLSNGDDHQSLDDMNQFNNSYHKNNRRTNEDLLNGMTHSSHLQSVLVDENPHLQKAEKQKPSLKVTDDINLSMDLNRGMMGGKHFRKTKSLPPNNRTGAQTFGSGSNPQKGYENYGICPNEMFVTVSEINLRTRPSQVPPPRRPPPALDVKKEDSCRLTSNQEVSTSHAFEGTPGESSPPFFDVEVDASSSASASAAVMKEVMEKAQVKLRSAKELMARKKEALQSHIKLGSKNDIKDEVNMGNMADGFNFMVDERVQQTCEGEDNGMNLFVENEKQKLMNTVEFVSDSTENKKLLLASKLSMEKKHGKESLVSMESCRSEGTGEWKEANEFYELVRKDISRPAFEQANEEKVLKKNTNAQECGQEAKAATEALEKQGENGKQMAREIGEWEENKRALQAGKEACEENTYEARSKAAREAYLWEEQKKSVKMGKEVYEQAENVKKLSVAQEFDRYQVKLTKVNKWEEWKNLIGIREKVNELEVEEAVKHKDNNQKMKQATDRFEHEEACERVEIEETLEETLKGEEKDGRINKVFEQVECEKRLETLKREEKDKKLKEVLELAENKKKQKVACEREENEKRLKKAFELEKHENRFKKDLVREENEKKQKQAHGRENDKRLKESIEQAENEKRLKKALKLEGNEEKKSDALKTEESEHLKMDACETKFTEKERKEAFEREDVEKRLKEARIREENEKILHEAQEMEENENRSREANEWEEIGQRSKLPDKLEESDKGLKGTGMWVKLNEVSNAPGQTQKDENEKRPKSAHENCVRMEGDNVEVPYEAYNIEESNNLQEAEVACNHEGNSGNLEASRTAFANEEKQKIRTEIKDCGKELGAVEVAKVLVDEGFRTSGFAQTDSEHRGNQIRMKAAVESHHSDDSMKSSSEAGIGIGRMKNERSKNVLPVASDSGNLKKVSHGGERGKNINRAQVVSDQDKNKDKLMSTHEVKEQVEIGRRMDAVQSTMMQGKGNTEKTTQQVSTSQSTERKEKIETEEKDKDWVKRERELEQDYLRKIEEEREREREREKDRMGVEIGTCEARERAYAEARGRAERAAVDRVTAEARQRALAEARERLEKACAEAREKSLADKASMEARAKAERAAVERATAEARERAVEKAMAEKAAYEGRVRVERSSADKYSASIRDDGMRQSSSSSDLQSSGYSCGSRHLYTAVYAGADGESAQRCKARLERHQRTAERAAKALAEKNMRDLLAQREQAERSRLAETLDAEVKRWSGGKEGNLRALLSTLQYILGPDSGWQPIPLTDVITAVAVKKAYRKATLCVHPDKLQQRGATIQQKYICEKVFDLLKEAWNRFNSEER
ncbi:auxilin-like protein 1 [Malania oleifera]|uniref:auxilin-like protein 1 n=1 Tax=Malania oleifera TaxID=397392 RepID=UPI0025ADDF3C|nr:auxilin-like protein 1 [Malania oleifera]